MADVICHLIWTIRCGPFTRNTPAYCGFWPQYAANDQRNTKN